MASRRSLLHKNPPSPLLLLLSEFQTTAHLRPRPSRPFTSAPARAATQSTLRPRSTAQPSMRAAMAAQQAELQRSGDILDHLGLIDGTLIMPRAGPRLPPWTSSPRARLSLEWRRLRTRTLGAVQSAWTAKFFVRPRIPILAGRREAVAFARDVYVDMNSGFARGELGGVGGRLAEGFRGRLEARLARRKRGAGMLWRLEGWVERPALASWRFVVLPAEKKTARDEQHGLVQAVVRLVSRQSLVGTVEEGGAVRPVDRRGTVIAEGETLERYRRECAVVTTEYLVVQRLLKRGVLGPWQAWGTAEESSLQSLAEDEAKTRAQMEAYKQMKGKKGAVSS